MHVDLMDELWVFLVWLDHRGDLEEPQLREIVSVIREGRRAETLEGWAEIAAGMEGWLMWRKNE